MTPVEKTKVAAPFSSNVVIIFIALLCFSLIVSDEPVMRDQFYNGNVKTERGVVIYAKIQEIQDFIH